MAVQIALEYFLQYLDISHSKLLKIFSDSQSTVGSSYTELERVVL